jgi:hypothetical protein
MNDRTSWLSEAVQRLVSSTKRVATDAARHVKDAWQTHRQRLSDDPAYGAAFGGVVLAACELLTRNQKVIAVIGAVTTAYIAISRAARHGTWDPGDDWPWES